MDKNFDFLIIGTGIAGLSFALKVADSGRVAILTKKNKRESNTNYAQGGIASVISSEDNIDFHIKDTLETGAGLCHPNIVKMVVKEGPQAVENLIQWGVNFSKNAQGDFDLGREGGHSHRRVLHAGDFTGQMIEKALLQAIKLHPNIKVFEHHFVIDLICNRQINFEPKEQNRCLGIYALNTQEKKIDIFLSKTTILCSGGAGKVYLYTSNPDIATGDGLAMAWRAGAKLANLEFVQFHPTCLYHPQAKTFLISEALRGEGGLLRLSNGQTFMKKYDSRAELAPRDIVARAIDNELKTRGEDFVLLDMTHLPKDYLLERFPNISEQVKKYGFDLSQEPIPVVPAAHYMCGGVMVNSHGETNIHNLFACGEVSFTGFHGANRLASNSLLEALVFANAAAAEAKKRLDCHLPKKNQVPEKHFSSQKEGFPGVVVKQSWDEIRELMWNYVGIVRRNDLLKKALKKITQLNQEIDEILQQSEPHSDIFELKNLGTVAELIIRSALWRKESRGLQYNLDYPAPSEKFRRDTILEPT